MLAQPGISDGRADRADTLSAQAGFLAQMLSGLRMMGFSLLGVPSGFRVVDFKPQPCAHAFAWSLRRVWLLTGCSRGWAG